MDKKEFGNYIKGIRESHNLSAKQVEDFCGVSNSYIIMMENGTRNIPSVKILKKLAGVYNVSYQELLSKAGYLTEPSKDTLPDKFPIFIRWWLRKNNLTFLEFAKILNMDIHDVEHMLNNDMKLNVIFDVLDKIGVKTQEVMDFTLSHETKIIEESIDYPRAIKFIADENNIPMNVLEEQLALLRKVYEKKS